MPMDATVVIVFHLFAIYINTESLCCAPETNTTCYVNYMSIKKQVPDQEKQETKGQRKDFAMTNASCLEKIE